MKLFNPLFRSLLVAAFLSPVVTAFAATQVVVNSTDNDDTSNSKMTLTEAIGILNGGFRALTPAEGNQVTTIAGTTNRINFNIPGPGPHFITAPNSTCDPLGNGCSGALFPLILASNVVLNGYSQSGSSPNTNSILASNNAVIKIVIDGRTSVNDFGEPDFGAAGNNVSFRGMSFLGGANCIGFSSIGDPVTFPNVGGSIQGCWIGVAPDRTTVAGPAIGTYLYQSGGFQVIGTDGDGVNDRNEFNVFVGCQEMAIGIEADGYATTNCRVSGNFIGVMPDGLTTMPQAALDLVYEGDCLESGGTENLIFGTDANGIADADERNIVGGLKRPDAVYGNCEVLQFWAVTKNVKVMGNYFGVGIDGVTPLGNSQFIDASQANGSTVQIGSDGDGVRDGIEANIIANHSDYLFSFGGVATALTFRRNSFSGNTNNFFDDPGNSFNGVILDTNSLALITPVISNYTTRVELVGWVPVSTNAAADNRTAAEIAIYLADPATSATKPQGKTWLASYTDNGPQDLDPATNSFRFNICALAIPATGAKLVVQETVKNDISAGSSTFSSALSLADVPNTLAIARPSPTTVSVSWQANGILQATPNVSPAVWTNVPGCSPVTLPSSSSSLFFRLNETPPQ